ncbi:hypothetical protein [Actinoplanes subglobosus]|uniref:STAS domain-containing protein n=1 Tax=Actinoplanes subglobosus TaxID=1547892 RepID=A0ABV8JA39_9ACTN
MTLRGEPDLGVGDELTDALAGQSHLPDATAVHVDLSDAAILDSWTIGVLLRVINPQGHVRRILARTGGLPALGGDPAP